MVCATSFPLVRAVYSNPLRSRVRKFESCRGAGQRLNSNSPTMSGRLSARPVTCGNADASRTLPPGPPPETGPQPAESPAQRRNPNDGQAVAVPGGRCSSVNIGSYTMAAGTARQYPGAAAQPTRSPLRPFGRRLILPSQAVRILTRPIRSGADVGPHYYGRMRRHARPRLAAMQIEAFWPVMGGCRRAGSGHPPRGRLRSRIRAVQDSHIELRIGAESGCPLT